MVRVGVARRADDGTARREVRLVGDAVGMGVEAGAVVWGGDEGVEDMVDGAGVGVGDFCSGNEGMRVCVCM